MGIVAATGNRRSCRVMPSLSCPTGGRRIGFRCPTRGRRRSPPRGSAGRRHLPSPVRVAHTIDERAGCLIRDARLATDPRRSSFGCRRGKHHAGGSLARLVRLKLGSPTGRRFHHGSCTPSQMNARPLRSIRSPSQVGSEDVLLDKYGYADSAPGSAPPVPAESRQTSAFDTWRK